MGKQMAWWDAKQASLVILAMASLVTELGCETEVGSPSEAEIVVAPQQVRLRKGESAEFTASGWHAYIWTVEHTDWGILSRTRGARTVYTAIVSTNGIQILTCAAPVTETNSVSPASAVAIIEHH